MAFGENWGARRLNRDDLHVGVLGLQVAARAGNRAARANARNKDIDLALGVPPNLRASRCLMDCRIRRIGELARNERIGDLTRELLSFGDSALHALRTVGQNHFGTVGLHKVAALDRHRLRHRDDKTIAPSSSYRGKTDARIARSGLDEHRVVVHLAGLHSLVDHRLRDAVLHRPRRVEQLDFAEDGRLKIVVLLEVRKLYKRSVADKLRYAFMDGHDSRLSSIPM